MPTLTKDTRCACCGKAMKAGEEFRWHLKAGRQGGSRARGTNDRYVPAHLDEFCDHRDRWAAEAETEQKRQAGIAALTAAMQAGQKLTTEQALAMLTGR